MVAEPGAWPWSSYGAMVGLAASPPWLETDWLLAQFGSNRSRARQGYAAFVGEGDRSALWDGLRHQVFLGSEPFVQKHVAKATSSTRLREVPRAQRRPLAKAITEYERQYTDRREAIARAFLSGAYTMQEIGAHFGVHYSTVSRAVRWLESH